MNTRIWLAALCLAAGAGCDTHQDHAAPATRPSAQVPAGGQPVAATQPAEAALPPTSVIRIGGEDTLFPAARLRLEQRDGVVWARLYSEDPPKDVHEPYTGNFYFFDMRLEVPDVGQLASAVWTHKAASSERSESPTGIFLRGAKDHLQPYDVRVEFARQGADVIARVAGQFLWFPEDAVQPQAVGVVGDVKATLQVK